MFLSTFETSIDGNSLVAFKNRLQILQDLDRSPVVRAAPSHDHYDSHGPAQLSGPLEQWGTVLSTALCYHLHFDGQEGGVLDLTPVATFLQMGMAEISDSYNIIMTASPSSDAWTRLTQKFAGIVDALVKILSEDSMTSPEVFDLHKWLRPVEQRLNATTLGNRQAHMPMDASPMSQVSLASPTMHISMSPQCTSLSAQCPPCTFPSGESNVDVTIPARSQIFPTIGPMYGLSMTPVCTTNVGSGTGTAFPYSSHLQCGFEHPCRL